MTISAAWDQYFDIEDGEGARLLADGASGFRIDWGEGDKPLRYELNADLDFDGVDDALSAGHIWRDDGDYFVAVSSVGAPQSPPVQLNAYIHLDDGLININGSANLSNFVLTGSQDALVIGGSARDVVLLGGGGTVYAKRGDDDVSVGQGEFNQVFGGDGDDAISASSSVTTAELDGGAGDDFIVAGEGGDRLFGRAGADRLDGGDGKDTIAGGGGADTIQGGAGRDLLAGGSGADVFTFATGDTSAGAKRDVIEDFKHGVDRIVFDNAGLTGFSRDDEFSGALGEVRFEITGKGTFIHGDVDGDKDADVSIRLDGRVELSAGDFEFLGGGA